MFHIDLNWADNQYWCTLLDVLGEIDKCFDKPQEKKRVKVGADRIGLYVKD